MALITLQIVRTRLPAGGEIVGPDPKWLARGLKSLYLLTPELWQTNLVTGKIGGRVAGTGVTFPNRKLYTPGTAGNGAYLAHGLTPNVAAPVTFVIGCTHLTGGVDWSILSSASTQWSGWYGQSTGFTTSALNSFDGSLAISNNIAITHDSSTSLRGSNGGAVLTDASATFPTVNTLDVALGWSRRDTPTGDNPAVAEFTHFAAIQGSLSNAELVDLARNPGQLFEPINETIWIPDAVAGGDPVGNLAATESGSDTGAFSGTLLAQGSIAATESAGDTAAFVGITLAQGTLAASESGADTAAFSGGAIASATGTLAAAESGADTAVFSGALLAQGTLAAIEGADTGAFTGSLLAQGLIAAAELGNDTVYIAGQVYVTGSMAAVETGLDACLITNVIARATPAGQLSFEPVNNRYAFNPSTDAFGFTPSSDRITFGVTQ